MILLSSRGSGNTKILSIVADQITYSARLISLGLLFIIHFAIICIPQAGAVLPWWSDFPAAWRDIHYPSWIATASATPTWSGIRHLMFLLSTNTLICNSSSKSYDTSRCGGHDAPSILAVGVWMRACFYYEDISVKEQRVEKKKKTERYSSSEGFGSEILIDKLHSARLAFGLLEKGNRDQCLLICLGGFKLMWGSRYWGFEAHTSRPKTEEIEVGKPSAWSPVKIKAHKQSFRSFSQRLSRNQVHQKKRMWVKHNCVYKARRNSKTNLSPTKKRGWNEGGK